MGVGFDSQTPADKASRDAVAIAIKVQTQIFVDEGFCRVSIIGIHSGQRPQGVGAKALSRRLARLPMQAAIGDFVQPLANLAVDIGQIAKGAQGPEVLTQIADPGSFDLTLLPGSGWMTGPGIKVVLSSKGQKARLKAHQPAVALGHGR